MKKILIKDFIKFGNEFFFREMIRDYKMNLLVVKAGNDLEVWGLPADVENYENMLKYFSILYSYIE